MDRDRAIRAYLEGFRDDMPDLLRALAWAPDRDAVQIPYAPTSEEGLRVILLFSSLYQDIHERILTSLLLDLHATFGADLFRLNRRPSTELEAFFRARPELRLWELRDKVVGILRSVGDFFLLQGNLADLCRQLDGEDLAERLSANIFFMGKTSSTRFKARTFVLLALQADPRLEERLWSDRTLMPPTAGAGRFLRHIVPDFGALEKNTPVSEKNRYFNQFCRRILGQKSWRAHRGAASFLERDEGPGLRCRRILQGCASCSLYSFCPAADRPFT